MKKIWQWVKAVVLKLLHRAEPKPAPGQLTKLDKILGQRIQKRQAREGRLVNIRQVGPNMPRRQPCTCKRWGRRTRKTMGGAYYRCSKHGEFFVRAVYREERYNANRRS